MQKVYIMNERLLSILDRWVLFVDKYDVMSEITMLAMSTWNQYKQII